MHASGDCSGPGETSPQPRAAIRAVERTTENTLFFHTKYSIKEFHYTTIERMRTLPEALKTQMQMATLLTISVDSDEFLAILRRIKIV